MLECTTACNMFFTETFLAGLKSEGPKLQGVYIVSTQICFGVRARNADAVMPGAIASYSARRYKPI